MILSEAQQALCKQLNISLIDVTANNNSLFTLAEITDFVNGGVKRAWDYKPWTFTEKTYQMSVPSSFTGYIDYPTTFEDESVYRLEVPAIVTGNAEFEKKIFADYQKWFSDYPTDTSSIWTEHERFIFFNKNAVIAGQEVDVSGKLRAPTLVNSTDLLPFSPTSDNQENSGNNAIILLALSDVLASAKKKDMPGSAAQEKRAFTMLDIIWKPIGERRAQKNSQNRPFFNTVDMFNSRRSGRNQTPTGNF